LATPALFPVDEMDRIGPTTLASRHAQRPLNEMPGRYQSLDIWRGIASLSVVVFHGFMPSPQLLGRAGWAPSVARCIDSVTCRLWIGVPIFFVISGYCIAAAADVHRGQQRPIHDFFARRIRRIYLPYLGALAITILAVAVCDLLSPKHFMSAIDMPNPVRLSWANWLGNLTLTESLRAGIVGQLPQLQLWPAWSLCHEVQFYAICGLFLLAVPRRFFLAAGALTIFVAALSVFGPRLGIEAPHGCALRGTWLMFAMGLAVYWQLAEKTARARWGTLAMFGVVMVWAIRQPGMLATTESNTTQQLFYAAITASLLVVLHAWDGAVARHPLAVPFARLGKISFSVYLIHFPIVRFFNFERAVWLNDGMASVVAVLVVSTIASVAAGYWFYLLVERRSISSPGEKSAYAEPIPRPHFRRKPSPNAAPSSPVQTVATPGQAPFKQR
jgi:peptidoglycan/LPS O-acetylase OafA/YrhL